MTLVRKRRRGKVAVAAAVNAVAAAAAAAAAVDDIKTLKEKNQKASVSLCMREEPKSKRECVHASAFRFPWTSRKGNQINQ